MKGLLLKDLSIMKTQGRTAVLIMAIALFMLIAGNNTAFAVVYANILFVTFGITTISYDNYDNGYAFLFTLPISRKLYVMEKYVFSMLSIATGTVLSLILMVGVSFIKEDYILATSEIAFVIGYGISAILISAIMLPVNLKFGPEKGRIAMVVLIAIVMSGIFAMAKISGTMDLTRVYLGIKGSPAFIIIGIFSVIVLLILAGSYLISCKIMENKEF